MGPFKPGSSATSRAAARSAKDEAQHSHESNKAHATKEKRFSPLWERLPLLSLWMLLGAIGGSSGVCVDVDFWLVLLTLVVVLVLVAGGRGCSVEVLLGVG